MKIIYEFCFYWECNHFWEPEQKKISKNVGRNKRFVHCGFPAYLLFENCCVSKDTVFPTSAALLFLQCYQLHKNSLPWLVCLDRQVVIINVLAIQFLPFLTFQIFIVAGSTCIWKEYSALHLFCLSWGEHLMIKKLQLAENVADRCLKGSLRIPFISVPVSLYPVDICKIDKSIFHWQLQCPKL